MSFRRMMSLGALALAGAASLAVPAQAQNTQVGTLTCAVEGGIGFVVGSNKGVSCTFQNSAGEQEIYTGAIRKLGIDIGITAQSVIVWNVFAPSGRFVRGALAGNYGGATAQATVAVGLGANALVGGSNRSFALQPLSISGQTGLNVAVGVADLELRYVPPRRQPRRG